MKIIRRPSRPSCLRTVVQTFARSTIFPLWLAAALWAGAAPKPLKVFILAGQSNMQGHANVSTTSPSEGSWQRAGLAHGGVAEKG